MMAEGQAAVAGADGSSLRLLGSVGEPINPEAWSWYYKAVGKERRDRRHLVADRNRRYPDQPAAGCHRLETRVCDPAVLRRGAGTGGQPGQPDRRCGRGQPGDPRFWPGQSRSLYGDHDRFVDTYFKTFRGYFTGDGARRDEDGYYWITGRVDDVLNVGPPHGHGRDRECHGGARQGGRSAVVGVPHDIKGQGIYVTLNVGVEASEQLRLELKNWCARRSAPSLPGCDPVGALRPSGKIMRRILRKITGEYDALGDISTLADPGWCSTLIDTHKAMSLASA